jgi:hypothetical protein
MEKWTSVTRSAAVAALALAGLAGAARADYGVVDGVDVGRSTVELSWKDTRTCGVSAQTRLTGLGGGQIELADLKSGDKARYETRSDAPGCALTVLEIIAEFPR